MGKVYLYTQLDYRCCCVLRHKHMHTDFANKADTARAHAPNTNFLFANRKIG